MTEVEEEVGSTGHRDGVMERAPYIEIRQALPLLEASISPSSHGEGNGTLVEANHPSPPTRGFPLCFRSPPAALAGAATAAVADGDGEIKSALGAGRQWATGNWKDEGNLIAEGDTAGGGSVEEDEFAGGFGSLDSMLQWAIGNSDPEKLKEEAADVQKLSADELLKRRQEIKDRQRALQELLVLVEPIDNANDLDKLGGLLPVIQELNNANDEIRTTSAWVLGTVSQNNALVQNQHILVSNGVDVRLQKKAVFLVTDLADFQLNSGNPQLPFLSDRLFLKSIVDMLSKFDLDLHEKALLAIKSLLVLSSTDVEDFEFYDLEGVLLRLGVQLEDLTPEDQKEFAVEVDGLRREVQTLFQQKLKGKVTAT
ncbi:hsp70 nucleotide exchange factor FES1-like [Panicum miliaceum]|uniref:Hsp70 nucleotide exchange factor FES1-like n=1 Tax=Panicum miliaceum TaxID=4540 RepID=A0A3L6QV77_PANMI|nr:hsp70 nucleotide exchange factor FES1-like [Panicum miliaceum]